MIKVDSKAFRKWFKEAEVKLKLGTQTAISRTAEAAATYARLSRLYKSHTYGLRNSIHVANKSGTGAKVVADARYAHWIENGTRAHWIEPKRMHKGGQSRGLPKQFLRFEYNGSIVFAKRVFHKGTDARPFMAEAQKRAEPLFSRLVAEAATNAFR